MSALAGATAFLAPYGEPVAREAERLRALLLAQLPDIIEQVDVPARMLAYSYGPRYADMICTIIPSRKGLKLGFYKGNELPDPDGLLEGTGKISRYVVIVPELLQQPARLKRLLKAALTAYHQRVAEPAKKKA